MKNKINKIYIGLVVNILLQNCILICQPQLNQAQPPDSAPTVQAPQPANQIPIKIVSGKREIPLCASLPLKGDLSVLGGDVYDGMNLFFTKIKKEKEFAQQDFFVKLYSLDDGAEFTKTRLNVKQLLKQSPLFISLIGFEASFSIMPQIRSHQILSLFPLEGVSTYRIPENKDIIYFRASHEMEVNALIKYSVLTLNRTKIGILYEACEWGEAVLASTKKAMKAYNIEPVATAYFPKRTVNIGDALNQIAKKAPTAILCIATSRPAYNFIRQAINKGLHKSVFFGLSALYSIQKTLKHSRGINIITSSVVPNPFKSNIQIAQEYRKDMEKYMPNRLISPYSFEGYINAALFYECIKETPPPLTIERIIETLENFKQLNFKGINLNFDPQTRTLSPNVWLNTGEEDNWILPKDIE